MATENSTIGSATNYKAMLAQQQRVAEQQRAFEAQIERMVNIKPTNGGSKPTNGGSHWGGTKGVKQYKFYCSSHRVNVSHHSGNCKAKQPGHNKEATYENKMGGSTRRNGLYMQWRDLDSGELCKSCPTGSD